MAENVACEVVKPAEVTNRSPSVRFEVEPHDRRIDLRPRPEHARRQHADDFRPALCADPDGEGVVGVGARGRGHAFGHFPLHGHRGAVEWAGQGEEVRDHRRRHAIRQVCHQQQPASRRCCERRVDRPQQGRREAVLRGERVPLHECHVVAVDEPFTGQLGEAGIDLGRDHVPGHAGQSFRQGAGAGAHLQHDVAGPDAGRPFQQIEQVEVDKEILAPLRVDPEADLLEELLDALGTLQGNSALNAMVLTGTGRLFSAGVDLGTPFFMENVTDPSIFSGTRLLNSQHRVIEALYGAPFVTIAAINGDACGGGGLGLAMACDMRISVRKARFWMVPMMLDVIQDFGLSWLMQRQIGVSRTMQMAVLGSPIPAEQGLSWGMLNELVEDQPALEARMDALAQHLGSMGSDALRMLKLIIRNGISSGLHEQLGVEAVANGLTFQSQEFKDKKAAYLNSFKKGKK